MKPILPPFTPLAFEDLAHAARSTAAWLWHGYLASGSITLLTGQWKCGKTTLLAALLSRLGAGGVLAGFPVAAGRAVVVSEESPALWHQRGQRFGFGPHLSWLCRPFTAKPTPDEWRALIDHLHGLDPFPNLVVIDPLASFLPGGENDSLSMLNALLPLQRLTAQGAAVLLLHHPSKRESTAGLRARGSGALSGNVDILIEMTWHTSSAEPDRRRRLFAFSRYTETPRQRVIELTLAGTDYESLGNMAEAEFGERWQQVRAILAASSNKLTRRALLEAWPASDPAPESLTLWRWLERARTEGLVCRDGTGSKNDPYRFWLPEKKIADDPVEALFRQLRADEERVRRMIEGDR